MEQITRHQGKTVGPTGPRSRAERAERDMELVTRITEWMDRRYIDPLLGAFLPGAGDTLGAVIGLFGVVVALRAGLHPIVIARMLVNLALDALLGSIPFLGIVIDFFYRAQLKNLELMRARNYSREARASDWFVVFGALLLLLFALILPILLLIAALTFAWSWLSGVL